MLKVSACTLAFVLAPALLSAQTELTTDDIVQRAIDAQERHEETGNEVKYDYELVSVTEKLDGDGEVEDVEHHLYRSHHIEGVAYERLVEKDGHDLDAKDRKREEKREEKFRDKLARGEAKHNDADDRVAFNDELLARYDVQPIGVRLLAGRECHILRFEPKPGKLPVRKTIDRALNKAEGLLWVDTETFEIARIEFELRERVRLWSGMMGSVSRMSGMFQRQRMSDGVWLPERFDFYMKGRMLFRSIHVRQKVVWDDFEKRGETLASSQ